MDLYPGIYAGIIWIEMFGIFITNTTRAKYTVTGKFIHAFVCSVSFSSLLMSCSTFSKHSFCLARASSSPVPGGKLFNQNKPTSFPRVYYYWATLLPFFQLTARMIKVNFKEHNYFPRPCQQKQVTAVRGCWVLEHGDSASLSPRQLGELMVVSCFLSWPLVHRQVIHQLPKTPLWQ